VWTGACPAHQAWNNNPGTFGLKIGWDLGGALFGVWAALTLSLPEFQKNSGDSNQLCQSFLSFWSLFLFNSFDEGMYKVV
jgi:hypothetical protein